MAPQARRLLAPETPRALTTTPLSLPCSLIRRRARTLAYVQTARSYLWCDLAPVPLRQRRPYARPRRRWWGEGREGQKKHISQPRVLPRVRHDRERARTVWEVGGSSARTHTPRCTTNMGHQTNHSRLSLTIHTHTLTTTTTHPPTTTNNGEHPAAAVA